MSDLLPKKVTFDSFIDEFSSTGHDFQESSFGLRKFLGLDKVELITNSFLHLLKYKVKRGFQQQLEIYNTKYMMNYSFVSGNCYSIYLLDSP